MPALYRIEVELAVQIPSLMAKDSGNACREGRPWRDAALAASAGYFSFCITWIAAGDLLDPVGVRIASKGAAWILECILNGLAISLIGLAFLVGWIFWGAALVGARLLTVVSRRSRAKNVGWFLIAGALFGLFLGWSFAWSWGFAPNHRISSLVAGAVSGALAGLTSWTAGRAFRS